MSFMEVIHSFWADYSKERTLRISYRVAISLVSSGLILLNSVPSNIKLTQSSVPKLLRDKILIVVSINKVFLPRILGPKQRTTGCLFFNGYFHSIHRAS